MANRPPFLCELDKGKLIDTQPGFVDSYNWAIRAIDNLKGGTNCEVVWPTDDHPVINVTIPEGASEGGGGSGGGGNVDDVASETYQGGESIKVVYADGSQDGHIPLSFVDDVSKTTYLSADALQVSYSSGAQDKYIQLPYIEGVTVYGKSANTTTNTGERKTFTFQSATNSNVRFTCSPDGTVTVGVYYI